MTLFSCERIAKPVLHAGEGLAALPCRTTTMHTRRPSAFVAIGALYVPCAVYGQFTDPRTYANTPVGVNQVELDYAHASADASIDTSLVIGGAHLEVNEVPIAYTHTFGILHHLAWVEASVPFAYVSGSVAGTSLSRSVAGAGDASLQLAALLLGGPALSVSDFEKYAPTTTVGVSLTATGPSGQYDPNRVLNLGSDRWSFKPEMGISHPFGPDQKWVVDSSFYVYFFTDNTAYHGRQILRQEPLTGFEAHISYNITPDLWVSLDANYAFRGNSVVDGVDQNDAQKNLTVGTETYWAFNSQNSIAFLFAKSVEHVNAPKFTEVALKYFYSWGRGY